MRASQHSLRKDRLNLPANKLQSVVHLTNYSQYEL
jgi:hypothetical protein